MASPAPSTAPAGSAATRNRLQSVGKIVAIVFATVSLVLLLMVLAGFFHRKIPVDSVKNLEFDPGKATVAEVSAFAVANDDDRAGDEIEDNGEVAVAGMAVDAKQP